MTVVAADSGRLDWNGRSLYYECYGSGPSVVVLLHGLLMSSAMNRHFARELAAAGHRVVLLDLLGHGQSDKPVHASEYRFDTYTDQVVALLDELGVERATVGGVSLGANVSLLTAARHPTRVRGLVLEMPVLEWAVPVAALTFVPLLLAVHYGRRVLRPATRLVGRIPRSGRGLDSVLDAASLPPEVISAVLHGILVGPIAPTIDERELISAPALVIGHRADLIHPFSDAENLTEQLPHARLVQGALPFGLRVFPTMLLGEINAFLGALPDPGSGPAGVERIATAT